MAALIRNLLILMILIIIGIFAGLSWMLENRSPNHDYSEFIKHLYQNEIELVELTGNRAKVTTNKGFIYQTTVPDPAQVAARAEGKNIRVVFFNDYSTLIFQTSVAFLIIALILVIGGTMYRNKIRAEKSRFASDKLIGPHKGHTPITFADVAGIPEAKEELEEIVGFLKNPKQYSQVGGNIPRGVLLQGPPGTGKTLLAKAVAGESGVPFYSFSGSDFVEMFVGVGASRVRDLFKEAKKNTPCIVFIDEIDAVGASRTGSSSAGGQDERGQTLNALLVEMDGFDTSDTIVVLAATNRPDILDPALRRPGRFDRQINILPPDIKGRIKILEIFAKKVKLAPDVVLAAIGQATPGFTGAELANLVNEAALLAGRKGKSEIGAHEFDVARDRILMGVERKGLVMTDKDRNALAYHEAGHAIIAKKLPETDPLHKITIIPRGRALGQTQQLPLNDRHAYSYNYLRNRITILMGGRAAEKIVFNQRSTGAQGDILQATDIATSMICKWGMSETLGPQAFVIDDSGFLGGPSQRLAMGNETSRQIDQEIGELLENCYQEAIEILSQEQCLLKNLAEILLQVETLDNEEFEIITECSIKKEAADPPVRKDTCSTCPAIDNCGHNVLTQS